ncbi:MAG: hypothetical protein RL148_1867 [Planctomycetota bacterium]
MEPLYPALLLLTALPGLVLVRSVRPLARLLALCTMAAVAVAALDLQQPTVATREAHAVVVATASGSGLAQLATPRAGTGPVVEVLESAPDRLGEALAVAAARAGSRTEERVLAWSGPPGPLPAGALPRVFEGRTVAAPLPFDPGGLSLRSASVLQRDRPANLGLSLPGAATDLALRVRVLEPGGAVALDQSVALPARSTAAVEWRPAAAGMHRIECSARTGEVLLQWAGQVEVVEPAAVAVLEDAGGPLAAALEAQGVRVVTGAAATGQLDACAALVLAQPLDAATAMRVADAVQEGMGLVLVGRALVEGTVLADLAPLRVLPPVLPPAPSGTGSGAGAAGSGPPGPDASAPAAAPPAPAPVEPPPTVAPPPPQPGERPPSGELPPAKVVPGGPVEVDRRSIAMVLVVDRSGSMSLTDQAGNTRMSYAKTAALRTAEALLEGDQVALVTFGNQDAGVLVLPLTDVAERASVRKGIEQLGAQNESTYLLDGLRLAQRQLKDSKAAVRHIVVVSDGAVVLDERLALTALAGDLARNGCTLSLIQISGDDTSPTQRRFAEELTKTGGGTYWPVADASRVPVLVSGEVVRALDRVGRKPGGSGGNAGGPDLAKNEPAPTPPQPEPERPKPPPPQPPRPEPAPPVAAAPLEVRPVSDSVLLEPKSAAWPAVARAVAVAGRNDAQTLLVVGDEGMPFLALANRGLGRVGALAAEPGSDNAAFFSDPAFPGRLAQWVGAVLRPLRRVEAANLVAVAAVEPARPTPAELDALGIQPASRMVGWSVPPPLLQPASRGLAAPWALAGIAMLVLCAAAEWWLVRRAP